MAKAIFIHASPVALFDYHLVEAFSVAQTQLDMTDEFKDPNNMR
jgi:hypothetical protein